MGNARNLRCTRPSAAPGAAALGFHFQLEHARIEGKPRRRLPSPCRRKKALSTRCQLICWPLLPTFLGGLGTQPNKGRPSPWQMPAGQAGAANISWSGLQLNDVDVVVYKGSKSPRPCCRSVERDCFGCARSVALVTSINMAGDACAINKCGVGSLVRRRKFDWCHRTQNLVSQRRGSFCALVFPSVGQDLRNHQTKAGYPEGFGRAFQPFVLLS